MTIDQTNATMSSDDDVIGSEEWNPRPETFESFQKRDIVLCSKNLQQLLLVAREPVSVKDLKEYLLHSHATIERVLAGKVASGLIKEDRGRFTLVR